MEANELMVPVYINEKIVLDMLAIIEDGFSMVSQVNYTECKENHNSQKADAGVSTSATLLSKLLKIDVKGEISHSGNSTNQDTISKEKVHTNVSLLAKFRSFLVEKKILKATDDISETKVGDFIEIEGELQKNPLINYMDSFLDLFRLIQIFSDSPELGNKNNAKKEREKQNKLINQVQSFTDELKHSGTIDFILSENNCRVVLSAQEQYLANDNNSEIIGGHFKVLGKVIAVCKDETDSIDLLRKTSLSVLSDNILLQMVSSFESEDMKEYNLPKLETKISGPAVIVIPIAIYA